MKTSGPLNSFKSSNLSFKDTIKNFWNKKEMKIVIVGLVTLVLVSGVVYGIKSTFFNPQNKTNTNMITSTLSSIAINANGLEYGSPLTLKDDKGNVKQILNGQDLALEPGKYTVSSLVDVGNGKTKGINEEIVVKEKENRKIDLDLKEVSLDKTKASAKELPVPSSLKKINGIDPIKNDELQITKDSKGLNKGAFQYPKVIPSPDQSKQTAVIIQPLLSETSLIKGTNSQNKSANIDSSNPSNKNGLDMSNITKEQRASLAVVSDGVQKDLAKGCLIGKVQFNQDGSVLRYFKVCDNGQNGFYDYNIKSKQETRVLPSSDYSNVLKIVSSPVTDLMVWTKPELGQFGIMQNEQFEVLLSNVYYTSPFFSPDGKYLIVMDNYLANKSPIEIESLKLSQSDQDQFGMKVRVVKVEDLLKNKEKAEFKEVGTTYFLPRPIDYDLDFIRFKDNTHFMAGDSSKIFSLLGEPVDNTPTSDLPGQIYVLSNGKKYRVYNKDLFNEQNQVLATDVNQIVQLQDKSLYFKSGDFLFRLVDDIAVQAFDKPISSINTNQNILQLVLSDGSFATFTITS